jgi:hypothetical protein
MAEWKGTSPWSVRKISFIEQTCDIIDVAMHSCGGGGRNLFRDDEDTS